jgi:hypothetical protein
MTIDDVIAEFDVNEKAIRFERLLTICKEFFGKPRIKGSHHIFKTPWIGDPRINLQASKGMAKPYQVRQVVDALRKLKEKGKENEQG